MPSRSNPDSPFLAGQLEALLGGRPPGTPTMAGQPGVQPASFNFPAPPAPAAAPPGRPPNPSAPAPLAPTTPTPTATPGGATVTVAMPPGGGAAQPAAAARPTEVPLGGVAPALSPANAQLYRETIVKARAALGPVPRIFRHPNLPELPVELGQPNFNPFTGLWS